MQCSLQLQMKAGEFTLTSDKMILSIISNFRVYYNLNSRIFPLMVSGAFTQDDNESQWINCQVRSQLYNIEKKNPTDYATCSITASW